MLDLPSTLKLAYKPSELGKLIGVNPAIITEVHFSPEESYVEFYQLDGNGQRIVHNGVTVTTRQYLSRDLS